MVSYRNTNTFKTHLTLTGKRPGRYILSVYSPFSDRVGLPLHNIISLFLHVMDIFSSSAISTTILYNHVLLGRPTDLLPSTLNSIHFFTQSSALFLITYPYYLSLTPVMTVLIGSAPTNFLNSSFVFHENTTHPSNVVVVGPTPPPKIVKGSNNRFYTHQPMVSPPSNQVADPLADWRPPSFNPQVAHLHGSRT